MSTQMLKCCKRLEKYMVGVLILGLVAGLILPSVGNLVNPYMEYILILIMFLSFLKIDTNKLIDQVVHPAKWVYLLIISMIIVPIVLFVITQSLGFREEVMIAILLISAMPAAMATPALSDIFKGNTSLTMIVLLAGSILTPFIVPWILKSFLGTNASYSFSTMMVHLAWMIFIPRILAQEVRSFFPKFVSKTSQYYTGIEIILLLFLVWGPVSQVAPFVYENFGKLLGSLGWMILISIIMHLIGWQIMPNADKKDKISSTLSIAYTNLPLAIVFANSFFSPIIAVMVILYDIPRNLMLVPFKLFLDKKDKKSDSKKETQTASTTVKKSTKRKSPQKAAVASSKSSGQEAIPVKKKTKKK